MKIKIRNLLYYLLSKLPINEKIITFESFTGRNFSGNPKAIYDEIKRQNLDFNCKIFINKNINLDEKYNPDIIRRGTIKWLYYNAVSKYWIKNTGAYGGLKKRNKQIYINTWHGIPIKKMGYDVSSEVKDIKKMQCEYVVSPNKYFEDCLNSSHKANYNYLKFGYPRNDIFYNFTDEKVKTIKEKLNIPKDKKVGLYAPTFRDEKEQLDYEKIFSNLSNDFVILYRAHYYLNSDLNNNEKIIDVSKYNDISDLMIISDFLITDYSSVVFDYLNLKKPIIFFAYDLTNYRDKERGFYLDYESLPATIVEDENSLTKAIENVFVVDGKISKKYEDAMNKFCYLEDGNASARMVEFLCNQKEENKRSTL